MKKLGLIGGMSWESTVSYYQMINRAVNEKLGGFHSAKILLSSVDFAEIERLQRAQAWPEMGALLHAEAKALTTAGADAIVICTNTMHKVADEVASNLPIPLLHIANATGAVLVNDSVKKVGLLGTKFTMEQTFYTERLTSNFDIEVVIPPQHERNIVHNVIYEQLCKGVICAESRKAYIDIIDGLASEGAEGVILGCTEIALLVQQSHTAIRLYDTTAIHAATAVDFAVDV